MKTIREQFLVPCFILVCQGDACTLEMLQETLELCDVYAQPSASQMTEVSHTNTAREDRGSQAFLTVLRERIPQLS